MLHPIYSTYNFKKCVKEEHLKPETGEIYNSHEPGLYWKGNTL